MKVVTVLGARPQFIKAGAVSRVIKEHESINEVIVHTGQHYDENMSDIFFSQMDIPLPDYSLGVGGLGHGAMTGRMLEQIEKIILDERPDLVMVYGDTNSTLAGALAAQKLHVPVAHVEAGLRSFNMKMPEEVNRILTDRISSLLFCPTEMAVKNLKSEGFEKFDISIMQSGDVMQDAALFYAKRCNDAVLEQNNIRSPFVLCTVHRAENTDSPNRLEAIINAINAISARSEVVLPLHPRTRNRIDLLGLKLNAKVIEPVGYLEMIALLKQCDCVMTDSGGLQKEAYFFAKPCVTLRDETEWVELVDAGCNILVGAIEKAIVEGYEKIVNKEIKMDADLYGGGKAATKIVSALASFCA